MGKEQRSCIMRTSIPADCRKCSPPNARFAALSLDSSSQSLAGRIIGTAHDAIIALRKLAQVGILCVYRLSSLGSRAVDQ